MKPNSKISAVPYIIWILVFTLIPFALVIYYAFTDNDTGRFTLDHIANSSMYLPVLIKSLCLAFVATLICLLIAYPLAYIMSRKSATVQRVFMMLIMLPMWMNFLLRTYAWMTLLEDNGVINNILGFFGLPAMKLINTSGAVILGMVYNYLPYMILPLYTVIMKIDGRLIEAAADLGCTPRQVFSKVILPLSAPGILSGLTMVFVPAVSTFYISQKLGSTGTTLIGDVIESQFKTAYNPNLGAAMSLVLMILIFICVSIMNRFGENEEEEVMAKV